MNKIVVLYHRQCIDGSTAAWVVLNFFARERSLSTSGFVNNVEYGHSVKMREVEYNIEVPELEALCTDADVYIVDFSYAPEQLTKIADVALSVVMIDHHETAIKKLDGYSHPKVLLKFDTTKSGAALAWEHFNKDAPLPTLIQLVQDNDLWTHKYPASKPFVRGLGSSGILEEPNWDLLDQLASGPDYIVEFLQIGNAILETEIRLITETAKDSLQIVSFLGHRVPILPVHHSLRSIAGELMNKDKSYPFSINYSYINAESGYPEGYIRLSFRSDNETGMELLEMLKPLGGGGHPHAAGLKVDRLHFYHIEDFLEAHREVLPKVEGMTPGMLYALAYQRLRQLLECASAISLGEKDYYVPELALEYQETSWLIVIADSLLGNDKLSDEVRDNVSQVKANINLALNALRYCNVNKADAWTEVEHPEVNAFNDRMTKGALFLEVLKELHLKNPL